jgi:hypothetical protein
MAFRSIKRLKLRVLKTRSVRYPPERPCPRLATRCLMTPLPRLASISPRSARKLRHAMRHRSGLPFGDLSPFYNGDLDAFRAMAKILSLNRFPASHPPEIRCHVSDGFFGKPP